MRKELEEQAVQKIQYAESSKHAIDLARDFSRTVFPSASLYYEVALSINTAGELDDAIVCYNYALEVDPNHVGALYDLAEIHLLKQSFQKSKQYLLRLAELSTVHWVVHYRLAQIAAHERDVVELKDQLRKAMHHGMPQQILIDDKVQWQTFLDDPEVSLSLEMFLQAIGQTQTWKHWSTPVP